MAQRSKIRLDQHLVNQGLAPDQKEAAALVMAGKVSIASEKRSPTPGMQVDLNTVVTLAAERRFVSRGGEKLERALALFDVDVAGKVCLDVGASTGGFTDCLLQNGASRVYAIDTGRGQLHHRLHSDNRVVSMERTNIADGLDLPEKVDIVVADVSFTSLQTVLPPAFDHLAAGGEDRPAAIVLLKPQFEAEKAEVPRGGVITDPAVHASVIGRFVKWASDSKIRIRNLVSSGILGEKGNREFLLHLEPSPTNGHG